MNKQRRKEIAKALDTLADALAILQQVKEDEETAFESLPESLQASEKGELMETAISNLDEGISVIEDAIESLTLAME